MNKSKLIQKIAGRIEMPQKYCTQYLETFLEILAEELKEGNSLMIQGFGSFSVWEQTERAGRNPRTGVSCTIPSRNSVKFKPGKTLLKKLNEAAKEKEAAQENETAQEGE